jgi:N-acetylglucosamine kinase-like BadF-type ATPase
MEDIWIADAGGTKTLWSSLDERVTLKGTSIHPRTFEEKKSSFMAEIKLLPIARCSHLYFYGAGCSSIENSVKIKSFLENLGFRKVSVFPDTLGSCRALLQKNEGFAGICGTGSVAMFYDGQKIIKQYGGLGPEFGDEGSGTGFGKILVEKVKSFDPAIPVEILKIVTNRLQNCDENNKNELYQAYSELAQLSAQFSLDAIHHENITNYIRIISKDVPLLNKPNNISISGTYAKAKEEIFRQVCQENNWFLVQCINDPIEKLVEFHRYNR